MSKHRTLNNTITNGRIILLSGPSGAGKTTLYQHILRKSIFKDSFCRSVSVTTRKKREGEINEKDYFFISEKMFWYKVRRNHFLEYEKVFDNYYGTPAKYIKTLLKKGKNVLLCIDVKGANRIFKKYPQSLRVFIKTSDIETLRKRLEKRGTEKKSIVDLRITVAKEELNEGKTYEHVLINDDLKKTCLDLENILSKEIKE